MDRNKLSVLLLGFILAALGASHRMLAGAESAQEKSLKGKWVGMIRDKNGRGFLLRIRSDGSFLERMDIEGGGQWKVEGNTLLFRPWNPRRSQYDEGQFEFTNDGTLLHLRQLPDGRQLSMTRTCGSAGATQGLEGEWFSEDFPGLVPVVTPGNPLSSPVFIEFAQKGTLYFRSIPLQESEGRYELAGKTLILRRPGKPEYRLKPYVIKRLNIRLFERGPELPFRRVTGCYE